MADRLQPGELALILSASGQLVLHQSPQPGAEQGSGRGRHVCTRALWGQDRIPEMSPCVHGLLSVQVSSRGPWALAVPPTMASAPGSVSGSFRAVCHEGNSVSVSPAMAHGCCDRRAGWRPAGPLSCLSSHTPSQACVTRSVEMDHHL